MTIITMMGASLKHGACAAVTGLGMSEFFGIHVGFWNDEDEK